MEMPKDRFTTAPPSSSGISTPERTVCGASRRVSRILVPAARNSSAIVVTVRGRMGSKQSRNRSPVNLRSGRSLANVGPTWRMRPSASSKACMGQSTSSAVGSAVTIG